MRPTQQPTCRRHLVTGPLTTPSRDDAEGRRAPRRWRSHRGRSRAVGVRRKLLLVRGLHPAAACTSHRRGGLRVGARRRVAVVISAACRAQRRTCECECEQQPPISMALASGPGVILTLMLFAPLLALAAPPPSISWWWHAPTMAADDPGVDGLLTFAGPHQHREHRHHALRRRTPNQLLDAAIAPHVQQRHVGQADRQRERGVSQGDAELASMGIRSGFGSARTTRTRARNTSSRTRTRRRPTCLRSPRRTRTSPASTTIRARAQCRRREPRGVPRHGHPSAAPKEASLHGRRRLQRRQEGLHDVRARRSRARGRPRDEHAHVQR